MELDTDVLIVGAGLAGLGFAIQLVRQYQHRSFELVEKADHVGGTWWANSYPGCGCDVVSHYYSFSFDMNPGWSQKYPLQPEILAYFTNLATKYKIDKHVRFGSSVEGAHWDESSGTWLVTIKDLRSSEIYRRRCKVLISAVGVLSVPRQCDIPGASTFQGRLFHTARWDHSFDWKGKEVIVIGNGCSASQAVPVLSGGGPGGAAKKITQFARQAQWIFERPNPPYSGLFRWAMRRVPLAMRLYRAAMNYYAELDFLSFHTVKGADIRRMYAETQGAYIRRTAPARYHEFLIPKTEVGCLRRVMDTDYLACLNRDNVELVYDDPIEEIVQAGARTKSGRIVPADAIVLANGFETQKPLVSLNIFGEGGVGIAEHWNKFSEGAASSYFGTCLSGFPNFFIMMGPNTASGHGSVIYTTECQINFALRVMQPILAALACTGRRGSRLLPPVPCPGKKADVVKVKPDAEQADIDAVQEKARQLVWASGCTSWALDPRSGRNTTMYPDFQYKYWLRSLSVPWGDFELSTSKPVADALAEKPSLATVWLLALYVGALVATTLLCGEHSRWPVQHWHLWTKMKGLADMVLKRVWGL